MTKREMTVEELDELERLEREATTGPWQSMRDGNQYVKTAYIPTAELVGASRVEGVRRPWNPHSFVAFGMKAEQHEIVRFVDADADLVAGLRNAAPALLSLARRALVAERGLRDANAVDNDTRELVAETLGVDGHRQWLDDIIPRAHSVMRQLREAQEKSERLERELAELRSALDSLHSIRELRAGYFQERNHAQDELAECRSKLEAERERMSASPKPAPASGGLAAVTIDGEPWQPRMECEWNTGMAGEEETRDMTLEDLAAVLAALSDPVAAELLSPLVAGFKRHLSETESRAERAEAALAECRSKTEAIITGLAAVYNSAADARDLDAAIYRTLCTLRHPFPDAKTPRYEVVDPDEACVAPGDRHSEPGPREDGK